MPVAAAFAGLGFQLVATARHRAHAARRGLEVDEVAGSARKGASGRRPDPPRPLRPRRQHARRRPGSRARTATLIREAARRRARAVHHDDRRGDGRGARDRERARGGGAVAAGADRCRDRGASVVASSRVEAVGPYALVRVERGGIDPGIPGQFFMLEAPGRVLPRPMSLCLAPPRRARRSCSTRSGPGTRALAALEPGDEIARASARSATAFGSTSRGRCSSAAASASRRCRISPRRSSVRRRCSASAREHHAEAAVLVPNAEVVIDPVLVTEAMPDGRDVLACGPEPMLEAVRALAPTRSSPGRRRWPAATARVTAASSRSTAS